MSRRWKRSYRREFVIRPYHPAAPLHKRHDPPAAADVPAQQYGSDADAVVRTAGLVRTGGSRDVGIARRCQIDALEGVRAGLPPRHQLCAVLKLTAQEPRPDWTGHHLARSRPQV